MKRLLICTLLVSKSFGSVTTQKMKKTYKDLVQTYTSLQKNDCKNATKALKNIDKNFDFLGKHYFLKSPGYKTSFKNFKRNIDALIESCKPQFTDKEYRNSLFQSLAKSCFQCHSTDRFEKNKIEASTFNDPLESMNFSLISRNYKQVEIKIDRYIKEMKPKSIAKVFDIEQDLYLKIHNDPEALAKRYKRRKNLPEPWNWKVKTWTFELENLPRYKKPKDLYKDAEGFIEKRVGLFVSESDKIHLKHLIGRLNHLLHEASKKDIPRTLLYLGSLENRLDHSYYSVDNIYLIECLEKYPSSPYAKQCFNEFMEQVNFSFTGSRGTNIPDSVKKLIKKLKPTSK